MNPPRHTETLDPFEGATFSFREPRTVDEMRQVLALRYEVYNDTYGLGQIDSLDHASRLDVDAYDFSSHHFALFARSGRNERVVGTLRITSEKPSPQAMLMEAIARSNRTLACRLIERPTALLPMLSYLEQAPAVRRVHEQWLDRGMRVAEAGRLSIHPGLRVRSARAGVRLSHFLMECAEATAWHVLGLDRVLIDCDVKLLPFYHRFGFTDLPQAGPAYQPKYDITFTVLEAAEDSLPEFLRPRVEALARQMFDCGEAVLESDTDGRAVTVAEAGSRVMPQLGRAAVPFN